MGYIRYPINIGGITGGSDLRPRTLNPEVKLIRGVLFTHQWILSAFLHSPKATIPSLAPPLVSTSRKLGRKSTSGIAKVGPGKMAAPLELSCWGGGWGLPSVHSESLVVMVRPPCGPGRGKQGQGRRREACSVGYRWLAAVPCSAAGGQGGRRCSLHRFGFLRSTNELQSSL